MYRKGDTIKVKIERLVFGGQGTVRLNNEGKKLTLFLEGVAPGDEVEAEIFHVKHNKGRARVKKFIKFSENRFTPRCPHFGVPVNSEGELVSKTADGRLNTKFNCGGCSWQFLSYKEQLKVKYLEIQKALESLNLAEGVIKPVLGMETPWFYRNKMEFSFCRDKEGKTSLGLHMKGRFYDVTEINECYIFRPWIGGLLQVVREWTDCLDIKDDLALQSLIVRTGFNTGEIMVNLIAENGEIYFEENFSALIQNYFQQNKTGTDHLVSLYLTHVINRKGQRKEFNEKLLWGERAFKEKYYLRGATYEFEIHPDAFLQPNTKQAEVFYSLVAELADLKGQEQVFDLFCGTGTIGMSLARQAKKVFGIELNEKAVLNAQRNAECNNIKNIEFKAGDVNKILPEMGKTVDVIVVDPPRAGLSEKIIDLIADSSCEKLIYVSCNPASLAQDLHFLLKKNFQLVSIQPIDQFCHTYHIESVCLLTRS